MSWSRLGEHRAPGRRLESLVAAALAAILARMTTRLWFALTCALVGCQRHADRAAADVAREDAPLPAAAGAATEEVRLLGAGAQPRRPLRYAWSVGEQIVRASVETANGAAPLKVEKTLRARIDEVTPEGHRVTVTVDDVRVVSAPDEALSAYFADVRGHAVTAVMDLRGRILSVDPDHGYNQHSLYFLRVPLLPAEPVGVGASWRDDDSERVFELTRFDSDEISIKVRYRQEDEGALERVLYAGTADVELILDRFPLLRLREVVTTRTFTRDPSAGWDPSPHEGRVRVELSAE